MIVTRLDVVNACLEAQGESPVNSLTEYNPAIAAALSTLDRQSVKEQARGWWFNKEHIIINPNADGYYYLPADTIGLVVGDPEHNTNEPWMSMRGRRVYDNPNGSYYSGTAPLQVYIIRNVEFDLLPFQAANLIRDSTVLAYIKNFDGDSQKRQDAGQAYVDSKVECQAEHIRAVRANMLSGGGVGQRRANAHYATTRLRTN